MAATELETDLGGNQRVYVVAVIRERSYVRALTCSTLGTAVQQDEKRYVLDVRHEVVQAIVVVQEMHEDHTS